MKIEIKKEFAATLFKVLSVYAVIEALSIIAEKFPYPYWTGNYGNKFLVAIEASASGILLILFGLIMWCLSDKIASSIFKSEDDTEVKSIIPSEIQIIAFSSVGLYLLCESIPHIAKVILFYYQIRTNEMRIDTTALLVERNSLILYLIIKMIIGVWLLLGSQGIVNLIRKTRRATP